jgi:hypothetical protein
MTSPDTASAEIVPAATQISDAQISDTRISDTVARSSDSDRRLLEKLFINKTLNGSFLSRPSIIAKATKH